MEKLWLLDQKSRQNWRIWFDGFRFLKLVYIDQQFYQVIVEAIFNVSNIDSVI